MGAVVAFTMAAETPLFSGTIPALITPFKAEGGINVDVIPALVELHLKAGVGGFYLCGNTGEGFACTVAERKEMLEATLAAVNGAVPILVHVGACPLADACELAVHAKSAGAAGASSGVLQWDRSRERSAVLRVLGGSSCRLFGGRIAVSGSYEGGAQLQGDQIHRHQLLRVPAAGLLGAFGAWPQAERCDWP